MNTVELKLPTLRPTQAQKSRGYAALTNHLKPRLMSTFDEKSLAKSRLNKTGTSEVGAISKAQKARISKYAQDVFMKSFENTLETPKVCLSCSI